MSPYCGSNQSHTHYTSTINAKACQQLCPGPQSAALPDHVSARLNSVWAWLPPCQPGYTAVSTCPECASAVLLWCMGSVWCRKAVAHSSAFRLEEPSGNANVCSNHLWLFVLICLPASCCMNGETHNGMMGYCQICMIGVFIHKVCFCNSKVKAGCSTRVRLQRLSSQTHGSHSGDFQRGVCFTSKLRNNKMSFAASFALFQEAFWESAVNASQQFTSSFLARNDLRAGQEARGPRGEQGGGEGEDKRQNATTFGPTFTSHSFLKRAHCA